ncbi:MAG TPA: SH3 domain-containing protein, partial [Caldilineaceae bacterium]|nr:SH3 domain-containing protein [Caldilineaceae bacterium]
MHLINRLLRLAPVVLVPLLVLAACNRPLAQTPLTSATELPAQPITETQTLSATNALTQSEPISPAEALVSATNALTQSELISPADTFILATATPAAAGAGVDSTNVAFVQALVNVNLRSGPGAEYEIVGQVFAGQTAQVTGVSSDGQWWRVICPDNTVGDCFDATDPTLTQPANAPGHAP